MPPRLPASRGTPARAARRRAQLSRGHLFERLVEKSERFVDLVGRDDERRIDPYTRGIGHRDEPAAEERIEERAAARRAPRRAVVRRDEIEAEKQAFAAHVPNEGVP